MPLPKLEPSTRVGDQVFEAIHAAIISGELPAGHRLRIRDLAADLGTSVMPVREAIARLQEIGLAESLPYRGAVVKDFSYQELLDLYAARSLLEVEATVLGAGRVSPDDVARMRDELAAMDAALVQSDAVGYLDRDEDFLAIVYAAAGNRVLLEMIRMLWNRCRAYKVVGAERELESGDPSPLLQYQKSLLDAIESGDVELAGRITAQSLEAATERIRAGVRDSAAN
ncbi:GntR family transcriptional regulator [Mycolicibacterium porcinum]|uniref:GntR family transcriptional regulator n=1 Tax=Mycolicibacterium porcinum TaxID=39693 RepID=UPI00084840B3|nr:GntR family transcriptional regulator [Mycolicibacterium porcinum]ODR21298.1 GntR family transcriptional regulator [Mycolicibacterium porcinum]